MFTYQILRRQEVESVLKTNMICQLKNVPCHVYLPNSKTFSKCFAQGKPIYCRKFLEREKLNILSPVSYFVRLVV